MDRLPVVNDWDRLVERFVEFVRTPCLLGSGPDMERRTARKFEMTIRAQLAEARAFLPTTPSQFTHQHVTQLTSMKTAGRGPKHQALWHGLWRAVVFDRDDYTCYFCHRSGEEGVIIPGVPEALALRLQLDHILPRCDGGADFELDNMRTACRVCNQGRFRLTEEQFRAEMVSLARSVWQRYGSAS